MHNAVQLIHSLFDLQCCYNTEERKVMMDISNVVPPEKVIVKGLITVLWHVNMEPIHLVFFVHNGNNYCSWNSMIPQQIGKQEKYLPPY